MKNKLEINTFTVDRRTNNAVADYLANGTDYGGVADLNYSKSGKGNTSSNRGTLYKDTVSNGGNPNSERVRFLNNLPRNE